MAEKKIVDLPLSERKELVDVQDPHFSQRYQCQMLGLHRSTLYYRTRGTSEEDLQLMRAIDDEYLDYPFYGRRRMTIAMRKRGFEVGPKRVRRAMQQMGLEPIYPKPNLSQPNKEHKKFPYLLRGLLVGRPDQVWAADITYIPMPKGFGFLFAIMDWFSRYIIEWELSNCLDTDFCLEALERGLERVVPEIFNTDQGVQFTSHRFVEGLERAGIRVSMDGKGRALDNVFVERFWRSVKREEIYPKGYEDLQELRVGLKRYMHYYNHRRPHQGLRYQTPAEVYGRASSNCEDV